MSYLSRLALLAALPCVLGGLTTSSAHAENLLKKAAVEVKEVEMPSNFDYNSNKSIRLTMDKSKILRLKDDAASVLFETPIMRASWQKIRGF